MKMSPVLKQLLRTTGVLFLVFIVAEFLPNFVEFPPRYEHGIRTALDWMSAIAIFFQLVIWANALVRVWASSYVERHAREPGDATTIHAMFGALRVSLWVIIFALVLAYDLQKSVTGLIAGLGIGGIAIAFALQNILGDLFASLSIVIDKPFVLGDSITVDTFSGTVERIGLKSTHVRSETGEQIIFANGELLKSRIRNFGRLDERQAKLVTRVAGNTTPEQLEAIPQIFTEIIEAQPATRFVRSTLTAIGDTTFDFTTIYYVTSSAYLTYAQTVQKVLVESMRRFAAADITLAAQLEGAVRRATAGLASRGSVPDAPSGTDNDGASGAPGASEG